MRFGLILLTTVSLTVCADTIIMKTGRTLEGKIIARDADVVEIEVEFGTMRVPANTIAKVEEDTPEQAEARTAKKEEELELIKQMRDEGMVKYKGKWVSEEEKKEAEEKIAEEKKKKEEARKAAQKKKEEEEKKRKEEQRKRFEELQRQQQQNGNQDARDERFSRNRRGGRNDEQNTYSNSDYNRNTNNSNNRGNRGNMNSGTGNPDVDRLIRDYSNSRRR